eukprot:9833855-Lingulodinium_polyedra.AAC.1
MADMKPSISVKEPQRGQRCNQLQLLGSARWVTVLDGFDLHQQQIRRAPWYVHQGAAGRDAHPACQ